MQLKNLNSERYCVQLDNASCLALPLSNSAARRGSGGNILFAWQQKWGIELASFGKPYKSSSDSNGATVPQMGSAGCAEPWSDAHSMPHSLGFPASERSQDYLYCAPFLFRVFSKTQSLKRCFLEGECLCDWQVIKIEHLLVPFSPPPPAERATPQAKAKGRSFSTSLAWRYSQQRIGLSVRPAQGKDKDMQEEKDVAMRTTPGWSGIVAEPQPQHIPSPFALGLPVEKLQILFPALGTEMLFSTQQVTDPKKYLITGE